MLRFFRKKSPQEPTPRPVLYDWQQDRDVITDLKLWNVFTVKIDPNIPVGYVSPHAEKPRQSERIVKTYDEAEAIQRMRDEIANLQALVERLAPSGEGDPGDYCAACREREEARIKETVDNLQKADDKTVVLPNWAHNLPMPPQFTQPPREYGDSVKPWGPGDHDPHRWEGSE